jgi:hypothetical protein
VTSELAPPPGPPNPADERLLDAIFHHPRHEQVHEKDCPGCTIAFEIAGELATAWDPLENWDDTPAIDGLPGDTLHRQVERVAAYVLHRRLPGHAPAPGRPPATAADLTDSEADR